MGRPIPKNIKEKNPSIGEKQFTTLVIDGSSLLRISQKDQTLSSKGKPIGGIVQFLVQLKILLQKGIFKHIYVMWDPDDGSGGILRWELYPDYKANRDGKNYAAIYEEKNLSDYMKAFYAKADSMMRWAKKKQDPAKLVEKEKEKEIFDWQKGVLIDCLEELYIRQVQCDDTEADDLAAYYVLNKKPNERIVLVSSDRDWSQMVSDDVILYAVDMKKFINSKNYREELGYDYHNVVLKKIICGDDSDNIKGIKGVGEKTLFDNMPEMLERECTLEEVIERARQINEDRVKVKKKPLKWAENIVNRVTDGCQGEDIYEINRKIIDLKNPLMTDEAKELIKSISYVPLSDDRSFETLYTILRNAGVEEFYDTNKFGNFFSEFASFANREKQNL